MSTKICLNPILYLEGKTTDAKLHDCFSDDEKWNVWNSETTPKPISLILKFDFSLQDRNQLKHVKSIMFSIV